MTERFKPYERDELDPEQQAVFDAILAGPRGSVPHIFHLFLASPDLASRVQALGAFCRYHTGLPPRLSELAILVVAHHFVAEYECAIHVHEARKAGVPENVIAALDAGSPPEFDDGDSALVYAFATSILRANDVPDTLFEEAVLRFGRRTTVELAAILGYYSMLAMVIRIFRLKPEGEVGGETPPLHAAAKP